MNIAQRIEDYLAGPEQLRQAIEGMTAAELDAAPIPGKWSTRQVVCHIADFEPVYADRMKWVIAEDNPPLPGADHNLFAERLAYEQRDVEEELQLISVVRQNMARILNTLSTEQFERTGLHSHNGEVSVADLLDVITNHIPHHIKLIQEKRDALSS
ncbi:Putative metal-dependent hydrolase YfiT [Gimesia panareensis]|uniref:Metal-dependent hydrolase YfiT n=1 Tax=Gimesia panareensis TaxID=2527978 RepID=A0A518FTF1_9PLAN|nr:DinB family protein [Gimesia panareensis]QDV19619.1 Putative metal-dependent hydrolase YfiT [Gimesia panareensis]